MLENVLTETTPLYVGCCEEKSIPRVRTQDKPSTNTNDEDQDVQVLSMYLY